MTYRTILIFNFIYNHPQNLCIVACPWNGSVRSVSRLKLSDLCFLKVRTLRMHLFTGIQLVCLGALWAVMSTQASLAFPFVLILTVPVKMFLLRRIFNTREMACVSSPQEGAALLFYTPALQPQLRQHHNSPLYHLILFIYWIILYMYVIIIYLLLWHVNAINLALKIRS